MTPPFIRPVPQQFPGTALSGAQTQLLGSLSFPAAGGVQAVDKTGAVLNLAGSGGAVSATVTDADNTGVSTALAAIHLLSSGSPASGIGVAIDLRAETGAGALNGARFLMTFTDVTLGSEDATLTTALRVGGTTTNALVLSAPSAGTNVLTGAGTANANLALRSAGSGIASLQGSAGTNIVAVDTTGGVSRLGFFNVTPLIRQTVADCVVAADGTSAGTQLNDLLAKLRLFGLLT